LYCIVVPYELLKADDLVLIVETEEKLIEKVKLWKQGVEETGLNVNVDNTKVMRCQVGTSKLISSG
jgi:hypothetical protein